MHWRRRPRNATAAVGVQLSPTGIALVASTEVKAILERFPAGVSYDISNDTSPFVETSIEKVVHTFGVVPLAIVSGAS